MNLLTTQQAADMMGVKPPTLRAWRCAKTGPPFVRLNARSVKYDEKDIEKYISERRFAPLESPRGARKPRNLASLASTKGTFPAA
jgi:predicted DNA-binding transcriptional regulator AlpA